MQISDIKYIEQVARAVIQAYELQTPVDLDDLVEKLGGKIINRKSFAMGSLLKKSDNSFILALFPEDNAINRRINILRELGYLFLCLGFKTNSSTWTNVQTNKFYSFNQTSKYTMANYFARCLILPEEEFKKVLQEYQNVDTLSKYFQVPVKTINNRLRDLYLKH